MKVVKKIKDTVPVKNNIPQLVVLGGGGYHPLSLARCWLGVWGVLTNQYFPEELPEKAVSLLKSVDWDLDEDEEWFDGLFVSRLDPDYVSKINPSVIDAVNALVKSHPQFVSCKEKLIT